MGAQSLFAEIPHTPNDGEIIRSIQEDGYAAVPFAIGKAACQEIFSDFRDFGELCSMPDGQQLADAVTYHANDKGNGDYHFVHRVPGQINPHEKGRAPGKDHKLILHFGVQTIERAKAHLGGVLPTEMSDFLEKCNDMYDEARLATRLGAKALGLENVLFSGYYFDDVHHLRLIDYVASDKPLLGEDHFDRSVATVALTESDTGLRGVPGQNGYLEPVTEEYVLALRDKLKPIEHYEYEAKLFLAAGRNRLASKHRGKSEGLPLLGHDIQNDRPGAARQSAVFFANPHAQFRGYTVPTKYETGFDDIIAKIRKQQAKQAVA